MKRIAILMLALTTSCGAPDYQNHSAYTAETTPEPAPPPVNEAERAATDAANERAQRIDAARQSDPKLNWLRIGISTGKFSESISSDVYKTYAECVGSGYNEANTCAPIAALPASYWDAGDKQ